MDDGGAACAVRLMQFRAGSISSLRPSAADSETPSCRILSRPLDTWKDWWTQLITKPETSSGIFWIQPNVNFYWRWKAAAKQPNYSSTSNDAQLALIKQFLSKTRSKLQHKTFSFIMASCLSSPQPHLYLIIARLLFSWLKCAGKFGKFKSNQLRPLESSGYKFA